MAQGDKFMFAVALEEHEEGRITADLTASTEDGEAPSKEEIVMAVRHFVKFLLHRYPGQYDSQTMDRFSRAAEVIQ